MGGGVGLPGVLSVGEEAQGGGDREAALVVEQLSGGVDRLRMVERGWGMTQGWRMRGREGVVAISGGGRVGSEGGASWRRFPGGVDPGGDGEGGCGHPTVESIDRGKFRVGRVMKRAGGGARR